MTAVNTEIEIEVLENFEFEIPCEVSNHSTEKTIHDYGPARYIGKYHCSECGKVEYANICEKFAKVIQILVTMHTCKRCGTDAPTKEKFKVIGKL